MIAGKLLPQLKRALTVHAKNIKRHFIYFEDDKEKKIVEQAMAIINDLFPEQGARDPLAGLDLKLINDLVSVSHLFNSQ